MKEGVARGRIDTVHTAHTPEAMRRAPRVDRHGGEVYVYRRPGQPCLVCGTAMTRGPLAGRNSTGARTCQPAADASAAGLALARLGCREARPGRLGGRRRRALTGRPSSKFSVSQGSSFSYAAMVSGWLKSWDSTIEPGRTCSCDLRDDPLDVRRVGLALGVVPVAAGPPPSRARSCRRSSADRDQPVGEVAAGRPEERDRRARHGGLDRVVGAFQVGRGSRRACPCRSSGCGPRCGCTACDRPRRSAGRSPGACCTCSPTRQNVALTCVLRQQGQDLRGLHRVGAVVEGERDRRGAGGAQRLARAGGPAVAPGGRLLAVAVGPTAAGRGGGGRRGRRRRSRPSPVWRPRWAGSPSWLLLRRSGWRPRAAGGAARRRTLSCRCSTGRATSSSADRDQRGEQHLLPVLADQQPGLDRQRAGRAVAAGDRPPAGGDRRRRTVRGGSRRRCTPGGRCRRASRRANAAR